MPPTLDRITVYPIKSLDGHDLQMSQVLSSGALAEDRRYALVDGAGKYVNAKNCAAIHNIRARFSDDLKQVTLSSQGQESAFKMASEQELLAAWCSEVLEVKCRLVENVVDGFPDDSISPGPTLVSTASLAAVASWFEGLDLAEARRRFRFNLEVASVPAFWEDELVSELQQVRRFRVGEFVWQGQGICRRCVVPTRGSRNGVVSVGFARDFSRRRQETLPAWAPASRFDHFYRLGVNTGLETGGHGHSLRRGDAIERID